MKVFESTNAYTKERQDRFCRLTFVLDSDRRRFGADGNFRGAPLAAEFLTPYSVVRSTEFPGALELPLGDRQAIGYYTDPMVLSKRALDALLPRIGNAVQLVPLEFSEGEYWAINVTRVLDALDVERSELERFPSSGRVSRVLRHTFKVAALKDQLIFKIPQVPARTFVTDQFVNLVNDAGLTGFAFNEVWAESAVTAT